MTSRQGWDKPTRNKQTEFQVHWNKATRTAKRGSTLSKIVTFYIMLHRRCGRGYFCVHFCFPEWLSCPGTSKTGQLVSNGLFQRSLTCRVKQRQIIFTVSHTADGIGLWYVVRTSEYSLRDQDRTDGVRSERVEMGIWHNPNHALLESTRLLRGWLAQPGDCRSANTRHVKHESGQRVADAQVMYRLAPSL